MLKSNELFLFMLVISTGIYLVLSQDDEETEEDKKRNCEYLNSVRSNLSICCEYPSLVVWRWQANICIAECEKSGRGKDRCCVTPCCFGIAGILNVIKNEDGSVAQVDVDPRGLIYSYLLSVGNDTLWLPVVTNSVNRCYEQFSEQNNAYDCDVIPLNLFIVINCAYGENYLKCPRWNPYNIRECEFTYKYVEKCM